MDTVKFGLSGRGALWLRLIGIGLGIGLLVFLGPAVNARAKGSIARAQRGDVAYEGRAASSYGCISMKTR